MPTRAVLLFPQLLTVSHMSYPLSHVPYVYLFVTLSLYHALSFHLCQSLFQISFSIPLVISLSLSLSLFLSLSLSLYRCFSFLSLVNITQIHINHRVQNLGISGRTRLLSWGNCIDNADRSQTWNADIHCGIRNMGLCPGKEFSHHPSLYSLLSWT